MSILRETSEFWRSLRVTLRAQSRFRTARRLRKQGNSRAALQVTIAAFEELSAQYERGDPSAKSMLAIEAVLLDELQRDAGDAGAARPELMRALQICEDTVRDSPKLETTLRQYIDWYRYRLAQIERSANL